MSRSIVLNIVAAVLILHGLAHMPGFLVRWRLTSGSPYKTTILGGRLNLGDVGSKAVGVLWLLPVIGFSLVAWFAFSGRPWWPLGALAVASGSLLLCLIELPEAIIGVVIDVVLIISIVIWQSGLGLIRLG